MRSERLLMEQLDKPTVTQANGKAEKNAALDMVQAIPGSRSITLGGDKNYDVHNFVDTLRNLNVTPLVAHRHLALVLLAYCFLNLAAAS